MSFPPERYADSTHPEQRRQFREQIGCQYLRDWHGRYEGQDAIICGLGPSLLRLTEPARYWTFGVNDIGRLGWQPDFLVILDRVHQIWAERADWIRRSPPRVATFQRLVCAADALPHHPTIIEYPIRSHPLSFAGVRPEPDWLEQEAIPFQDTTVFSATVIAWKLGFRRIGVIGMDMGHGYAWAPGGPHRHVMHDHQVDVNAAFELFVKRAKELRPGTEVVNLSPESPIDWGGNRGTIDSMAPKREAS